MTAISALLLRILLIILAVWVIRRILTMFLGNKKAASSPKNSIPDKNMVKDPVCGMYMDPRLAVKYEVNNGIFYFCSEKCKNNFLESSKNITPDNPQPDK